MAPYSVYNVGGYLALLHAACCMFFYMTNDRSVQSQTWSTTKLLKELGRGKLCKILQLK